MADERVSSFLQLAADDLDSAKALLNRQPRHAAYHVSQAAEKAARALCEHAGKLVGTTHSLAQIAAILGPEHPLSRQIVDLDFLSSASTKYRYPNPNGRIMNPDVKKLPRDIEDVEAFIDRVREFLKGEKPAPAVKTEAERKSELVEKIVAAALASDLELPPNAAEVLAIYADERTLHEMWKGIRNAGSFQDLLSRHDIRVPGLNDD